MKKDLRVLHVGSVALGNPFTGLALEKCKERYHRFSEVFDALFDYIRTERIDLVLFSGNLCGRYLTSEDAEHLIRMLASLPDCRFVISPGDQDPYEADSLYASGRLPKNVSIFENETLDRFDFPDLGVSVYGWAIHSTGASFTPLAGATLKGGEAITLISGCCDVGTRALFARVSLDELATSHAAYAAFSHGAATAVRRAGQTAYCHAGPLEGRSFEESGKGGAIRIDLRREPSGECRTRAVFVPLGRHHYETVSLDITGAREMDEVLSKVHRLVAERGYGETTSLRVILEGQLAPTVMLRHTAEEMRAFSLYSLELVDHTLPTLDAEYLDRDMTVRGELYRTLKNRLSSHNLDERVAVSQAFRAGLAALEARDITGI